MSAIKRPIIVYTKKEGINQLLQIDASDNLISLSQYVKAYHPEHVDFAYALVDGIEIKLF